MVWEVAVTEQTKKRLGGQVAVGVLMIAVGAIFLLDNLYYLDMGPLWRYWPLIFVVFGIQKLVNAEKRDDFGSAIWLFFLAAWLFVSFNHVWDLDFGDTWPFLIIAWGVSTIWKSLGRPVSRNKEVIS